LLNAKGIVAIEDQSPLVTAALHRFLLAVLYRALEGPTDIEEAKILFRGGLQHDKIEAYLEEWRDRFWLFDDKHPFGQNPNVPKDEIEPWTKLTAEYNATSNKVLFDHTDTKKPGERSPKECARWLLSTMSFSIAGGRGYYPSPSPNAMMCIPQGKNLHEALCYCLVPQNRIVIRGDVPLWERTPVSLPLSDPKRSAKGYADLFTWQSRMILLEPLDSGDVAIIRFVAGEDFDSTGDSDPMQPFRVDRKYGKLPVQFREDRGIWRDFDSLLPDRDGLAPATVENAIQLSGNKSTLLPSSILVLGLRYTPPNANLDFWRMERFVLPQAVIGDNSCRTLIREYLNAAEKAGKALWNGQEGIKACLSSSVGILAKAMLSRGERSIQFVDIKNFAFSLDIVSWYWSTLESCFHEILNEYTLDRDPEDIRCQWLKSVRDTLRASWEQYCSSVSMSDAWVIRAIVKSEGPIQSKLKELNGEIAKLEPQEEEV
jgi:CRISPR system Cascade subunit CasA